MSELATQCAKAAVNAQNRYGGWGNLDEPQRAACVKAVSGVLSRATGWQPIETAPKGKYSKNVLLYEDGDYYAGSWNEEYGCWASYCGQPVVWTPEPTHWMPLPKPPTGPDEEDPDSPVND